MPKKPSQTNYYKHLRQLVAIGIIFLAGGILPPQGFGHSLLDPFWQIAGRSPAFAVATSAILLIFGSLLLFEATQAFGALGIVYVLLHLIVLNLAAPHHLLLPLFAVLCLVTLSSWRSLRLFFRIILGYGVTHDD